MKTPRLTANQLAALGEAAEGPLIRRAHGWSRQRTTPAFAMTTINSLVRHQLVRLFQQPRRPQRAVIRAAGRHLLERK